MGSIKRTVDRTPPSSLSLSLSLQSNDVIALEANNERIQDLYYLLLDSSSSTSSSSSSCSSNTTSAATTSNSSCTSTPIYSPCGGMRQSSSPYKNNAPSPYKIGPDRDVFVNQIKDERDKKDGKADKEMESEQDENDGIVGSSMLYKEDNAISWKSLKVITDSENVLQDVEKVHHLLLSNAMLPCPVLPSPIACPAVLCYPVIPWPIVPRPTLSYYLLSYPMLWFRLSRRFTFVLLFNFHHNVDTMLRKPYFSFRIIFPHLSF